MPTVAAPTPNNEDRGKYARYALDMGWDPIPLHGVTDAGICTCHKGQACKNPGKHPIHMDWPARDKVASQDTYSVWDLETRPVNVGLRTGEASGFWTLDIDPKDDGDKKLAALVAKHGALPETHINLTGSGGDHHLFTLPADFIPTISRGTLPKGIDVRGNNGLIVAPGSVTNKGIYRTKAALAIAAPPTWLVDAIRPPERTHAQDTADVAPKVANPDPERDKFARHEVTNLLTLLDTLASLPEGKTMEIFGKECGWDEGLLKLATRLVEVGRWPHTTLTVDEVRSLWGQHAPADFAVHKWGEGMKGAAASWKWGDEKFNVWADSMGLGPKVKEEPQADIAGEMRDRMTGNDDDDDLWVQHKNGTRSLNIQEAANRIMHSANPVLVDASGSFWAYQDSGVFVNGKRHVSRQTIAMLGKHWNPGHAANVEKYIRAMAEVLDFDEVAHPDLVNFRNTMVNWRTLETVDHSPDHRSTFQVNADWDPDAEAPLFSAYLDRYLDPETARLVWQIIGYSMLSGNPMQVFVLLHGKGGNGKGVVMRAMIALLGASNVSSLSMGEIDGENRFKLARMVGRAANIAGETQKTHIRDSSNLKKVTGGDRVDVEQKGVDGADVMIHALPIFSVNEVPSLGDDSDGLYQRMIVAQFNRPTMSDPIPNFDESLFRGELAGIARKGLAALQDVRFDDPSLRAEGFTLGESGYRARATLREQANDELDWVNNHLRPADDFWMTPKELYEAYGGRSRRTTRKFMSALRERFGDPVTATPSIAAMANAPAKNSRVNCYGVRVSEDRIDTRREIFGTPNTNIEEAS